MLNQAKNEKARQFVTERCLIAADVDRTILSQDKVGDNEAKLFHATMAHLLEKAAELGTNIAFVTGNSTHELCSRVLRLLVQRLSQEQKLSLISRFHFFCSSGGVYFYFPNDLGAGSGQEFIDKALITTDVNNWQVNPQFIHSDYVARTSIDPQDITVIKRIAKEAGADYTHDTTTRLSDYSREYKLSDLGAGGTIPRPRVEVRSVQYKSGRAKPSTCVQITLKPVLSFRHARTEELQGSLNGNDPRSDVVREIQTAMDLAGLGRYEARIGGKGSVDITLERLDKAYALDFLIDNLGVEGNPRFGQQRGSNTIYFGDEVIYNGNDYPITRIPGVLVFAVNENASKVPFRPGIHVPSVITVGPHATAEVLDQYNRCAEDLIDNFDPDNPLRTTAIDELKRTIFTERIESKIAKLKASKTVQIDDWATLHTIITLMSREDPTARQWLSMLVKQLDDFSMLTHANVTPAVSATGTSYDE